MDHVDPAIDLPAGFEPLFRSTPFLDLTGPLFYRKGPDGFVIGMRVLAKHTNASGSMHGGMISTLADISLGYTAAFSRQPPIPLTTASLSLDFAGVARLGDWVEVQVDIQKIGSRLAFANGYVVAGGQPVARVSGVFSVIEAKAGKP